jgi:hypothetical protein
MCQVKSAIVLKDRIYMPLDENSHNKMLEDLKIKDNSRTPNFVRIEYVPKDGDVFNHKPENWQLNVDQDYLPDWFVKEETEEQMKKKIHEWFNARFIIDQEVEKIESGLWYMKGGTIQSVRGGTIQSVRGGTIQSVRGGTIQSVRGGTIQYVEGGTIQYVEGGTIQSVEGGTIQYVEGGTIQSVRGGTIQSVWGGTIQYVEGGTIQYVEGGTIQSVRGGTIEKIQNNGIVIYANKEIVVPKGAGFIIKEV